MNSASIFSTRVRAQLRRRVGAAAQAGRPLRVWVPRCGGGVDAYLAAAALLEASGGRWRESPARVYATAAEASSLAKARAGRYHAAELPLPKKARARFFARDGVSFLKARPALRAACVFTRQTLDAPPFSRLDVVVRGALPGAPASSLQALHKAMAPGALLVDLSGQAGGHPELFLPIAGTRAAFCALPPLRAAPAPEPGSHLQESEAGFRALFSNADEAVLVEDAATGVIADANASAQRLYGRSLQELQRLRMRELLAPRPPRRLEGERRSAARRALPLHRRGDGSTFSADSRTAFMMAAGRPARLWIVRDATERLRAQSLQAEKEKRQQDEAFMGEVVHELRSPLAVIRGFAETLHRGVRKADDRSEFLKSIESQTGRMALLVDRLLDLSAATSARPAAPVLVPLASAVWDVAGAFALIAKRAGVALKIDVSPELAVLVDRADFPHMLGNLIDNAIKYNRRGGLVAISARAEGSDAVLSVEDTGAGLPAEDLEKIFQRFFRSERTRATKGTGLGLAIVRAVAGANHGRVWAEQAPAGGARFNLALPLAAGGPLS